MPVIPALGDWGRIMSSSPAWPTEWDSTPHIHRIHCLVVPPLPQCPRLSLVHPSLSMSLGVGGSGVHAHKGYVYVLLSLYIISGAKLRTSFFSVPVTLWPPAYWTLKVFLKTEPTVSFCFLRVNDKSYHQRSLKKEQIKCVQFWRYSNSSILYIFKIKSTPFWFIWSSNSL